MPATAAAAPMTPSEPTTLRALGLEAIFLAFMSAFSLWCPVRRPDVSGDKENFGGPTAGHPPAIRKESARVARRSLGSGLFPGFRAFSGLPGPMHATNKGSAAAVSRRAGPGGSPRRDEVTQRSIVPSGARRVPGDAREVLSAGGGRLLAAVSS